MRKDFLAFVVHRVKGELQITRHRKTSLGFREGLTLYDGAFHCAVISGPARGFELLRCADTLARWQQRDGVFRHVLTTTHRGVDINVDVGANTSHHTGVIACVSAARKVLAHIVLITLCRARARTIRVGLRI